MAAAKWIGAGVAICLTFASSAACAMDGPPETASTVLIESFKIQPPTPGSAMETGALHLSLSLHSDALSFDWDPAEAQRMPMDAHVRSNSSDWNHQLPKGIGTVQIGATKDIAAWTVTFASCCTSYAIPMAIAVYRYGSPILWAEFDFMIWGWKFVDDGTHIAVVGGTTHGIGAAEFCLLNTKTGSIEQRIASPVKENNYPEHLPASAPAWARSVDTY